MLLKMIKLEFSCFISILSSELIGRACLKRKIRRLLQHENLNVINSEYNSTIAYKTHQLIEQLHCMRKV